MCLIYGPVFCSMKKILTIDLLFCFASLFLSFFYILCILQNKRNKASVATALATASSSAAHSRKQQHPDCLIDATPYETTPSPLSVPTQTTACTKWGWYHHHYYNAIHEALTFALSSLSSILFAYGFHAHM